MPASAGVSPRPCTSGSSARSVRLLSTLTICNPLSNLESAQVGELKADDDGRCIITTPGPGYVVGEIPYVFGSGATFRIRPCDWVLRLVAGCPRERWAAPGVKGVSVRPAYEALLEGLANRGVHESLVAARARLGNIPRYHRGTHGGIPGLSVALTRTTMWVPLSGAGRNGPGRNRTSPRGFRSPRAAQRFRK